MSLVVAVDGGNSKTHLALVSGDGALLAVVRGPHSSPHRIGVDGSLDVLGDLLGRARAQAGLDGTQADVAELVLAGADLPSEEQALQEAVEARAWAREAAVANDTFAVLRAGTAQGWGVAVVCGAGSNCVGVAPDGRHARFLALGRITGDWGGGEELGLEALAAAARSEDGRGPRTVLEHEVPAHFGMDTPLAVAAAIHLGDLERSRLLELAPLVLARAEDDVAAARIVDRQAAEIVAFARAAIERLELQDEAVPVVLGGGLLQAGSPRLLGAVEAGVKTVAPRADVIVAGVPPIVGAALLGLDRLGAGPAEQERARKELAAAVATDEARRNGNG